MKILIDIEDAFDENLVLYINDIKLFLESCSYIINSIEDVTNANLRPTDTNIPTPPASES